MSFVWTPLAVPSLAAALLTAAMAIHLWRHRSKTVGAPLLVAVLGTSLWMFSEALGLLAADLGTRLHFLTLAHVGVGAIGPSYLLMSLRSGDRARWIRPRHVLALASVPVFAVIAIATNDSHGFIYSNASLETIGGARVLVLGLQPAYWCIIGYNVLLVSAAIALAWRKYLSNWSLYSSDAWLTLVAVSLPVGAVALDAWGIQVAPGLSLVPIGVGFMTGAIAFGLRRGNLFDVVRVGRNNIIDSMTDGVLVIDMDNRLVDINAAACSILSLGPIQPAAQPLSEVFANHPDLIELLRGASEGRSELRIDAHESEEFEESENADALSLIYDLEIVPLYDDRDDVISRVLLIHDISERVRAQEELKRKGMYLQLLQEVSVAANAAETIDDVLSACLALICRANDWKLANVLVPDADGVRLESRGIWYASDPDASQAFIEELQSATYAEGDGTAVAAPSCLESIGIDRDLCRHPGRIAESGRACGIETHIAVTIAVKGEVYAVLQFFSQAPCVVVPKMRELLSNLRQLMGNAIERRQIDEQVRELAFRDPLTGLPNRQAFQERLAETIEIAAKREERFALLFIDLDGFKKVNDTLGHRAGDELLRNVASRFSNVVRQTDVVSRRDATDVVSRLGGDEFTVLLSSIANADDPARVALRLIEALAGPITLLGDEVFAGASVGIAVYPEDGCDADTLLSNADVAMYHAKGLGTNRHQFFSLQLSRTSARRLRLEGRLRGALDRKDGEFCLHYQALRDARTSELVGAEALLRWTDAVEGEVAPDIFIPIAEEMGLIIDLGEWVLRTACQQLRTWREQGYRPIRIAVNVSSRQLRAGGMPALVESALAESGCSPDVLELEITESSILEDDAATRQALQAITAMGVEVVLDDFGTGYSSLTHLRTFPIARVKIDRSFVKDMTSDPDDAALTRAIIAMAHTLRVKVIAEGVETEEQARLLRESDCDELQGYLFGRPATPQDFERYLTREKQE